MKKNLSKYKDVVCGMKVNTDELSLEFMGCHYVFCSNQCLERFQLNPYLYIGHPGSKAPKQEGLVVLKKRKLKLAESLSKENADQLIEYIEVLMGIHKVKVKGDCVTVVYDLLQTTESQIEQAIDDAGIVLGNELMEKIKRAFVHCLEETEVSSLEVNSDSKSGHHH